MFRKILYRAGALLSGGFTLAFLYWILKITERQPYFPQDACYGLVLFVFVILALGITLVGTLWENGDRDPKDDDPTTMVL